jgi:mono/diheme cytochrome c family protein
MKNNLGWVVLSVLALAVPSVASAKGAGDAAKRGQYLVTVGGCNDCHTPMKMTPVGPVPDMDRMLSGHPEGQADPTGTLGKTDMIISGADLTAFTLAFGTVYTRNLTPDKTGLADWTEAQFIKTLRTGHHQGDGRALLAPMPWPNFAQMTDDDLKAVWAFLRSIKPIKNTVPDPKVPPQVIEQFNKNNAAIVDMMKQGAAPPPKGK